MTRFFFAPESPRRLALIRIAAGLILLWESLGHWPYAVELYSSFGPCMPMFAEPPASPVAASKANETASAAKAPAASFRVPIPSPGLAVALHSGLVFAALAAAIGWQTRLSLITSLGLFGWLAPLDLAGSFAKHPVIILHLLLILSCSGCGGAWAVDSWIGAAGDRCRLVAAWPRRLIQILVCAIYFGAALTKLRSPTYATGELLEFSLLDYQWGGGRFGLWLATLPRVLLLLSLATLLIELLFPFLVWIPRLRLPMLALAFALHAGMGLALDLGTFSPTMFAALLAFLRERDFDCIPGFGRIGSTTAVVTPPAGRRRGLRALAMYVAAAAAFIVGGTAVQRWFDWYGAFGVRSPVEVAAISELSKGPVANMLAGRPPAFEDYFHRVTWGSRLGRHAVFGDARRFRHGERVYVLAQLILPHPPVLLEGLLIAPDGREAARFSHRIAANVTHTVDGFELTDELPAGNYRVILQVEGVEFLERTFELRSARGE